MPNYQQQQIPDPRLNQPTHGQQKDLGS
uniref:Uncharacterized protein n=1 Tax=Rhizophora mucronata TaxID=61149 RepID=A0A2P2PBT3_RHIMU